MSSDADAVRITTMGPLVVAAWHGPPSRAAAEHLRGALLVASATHGAIALLDLVVAGRPTFSEDARSAIVSLMREVACDHGVAHVVLLRGIAGTAVRMFLNGALLLARPTSPSRAFDELEPALVWLAGCGCTVDPASIRAVAAELAVP